MSGLTNSEYALWLNETAAQDCGEVQSIYIKHADESTQTITNDWEICSWMEDTDSSQIADVDEVKFSGVDDGDQPWHAIDKRLTTNLERTVNYANVPIKIRRPTGS